MSTTLRTSSLPTTITIRPNLELSQGFYVVQGADAASTDTENPLILQLKKEVEELGKAIFKSFNPKIEPKETKDYFTLERLFHKAIEIGKPLTTEALLQQKISPDARLNGLTPLFQACLNGNKAIVKLLLNHHANPNQENSLNDRMDESSNGLARVYHNATPLSAAAHFGDIDIVKLLQGKGAKLHEPDSNGGLPIFYAAKSRKDWIAREIFLSSVEAKVDDAFHLLLMDVAIRNGLSLLVQQIVGENPNIFEKQDRFGENVLHKAAASVHKLMLLLLLEKSPNKTVLNHISHTTKVSPLGVAITLAREENVKVLVDAGADLRNVSDGKDALSYAKDKAKDDESLTSDEIKKRKAIVNYLKKGSKQQQS